MSETSRSRALAVHARLFRWRFWLFGIVLAHFLVAHYFFLGFVTWDGFGHRVPPLVELTQHGSLGLEKFANWALVGYRPFVELANVPFLAAFGLPGLYFAYALTVFPLCTVAIHLFVKELTGSPKAAFYGAAVYVLTPLVNAQVFSGYVDFAIVGLLAYFLYTLIALAQTTLGSEPTWKAYAKVATGTFLFTMARQQAPYVAVFFFAIVGYVFFVERSGFRFALALTRRKVLARSAAVFATGIAPAVVGQILNIIRHGSPIHPYQFQMFGVTMGKGFNLQVLFYLGGLDDQSPMGFAKTAIVSWLVPTTWPRTFFDGRNLGGGLFLLTALVTLPFALRRANGPTRALLAAFVVLSLALKDFWQPRYAYTILLGLCVCNGLALAAIVELASKRARFGLAYGAMLAVLALHAFRPEWDVFRMRAGDRYTRMNASNSALFLPGIVEIQAYPDMSAHFVIANAPFANFILPIYGRRLTNTVLGSVPAKDIGPRCEGLHVFDDRAPDVLVIDDENLTKDCERTCVFNDGWSCRAYKLGPAAPPAAANAPAAASSAPPPSAP